MYGFTLAISCSVKTSNIPSKFVKYIDVPLFKAVTEFMAVITEKCLNLWRKAIVLKPLRRTMDKSDDDQNGERKFCICKETYEKNSSIFGCDNWYHLACLKLKDFPKVRKWYRKLCKSSKK